MRSLSVTLAALLANVALCAAQEAPEIRLSGQLPLSFTTNASSLPTGADKDGYSNPLLKLSVTFKSQDDLKLQFFADSYSELYRRQFRDGFDKFSAGFWLKYRTGDFDFAAGYAARRAYDQEDFRFTVQTHDLNLTGSYFIRIDKDITFVPTLFAARKFATIDTSTKWRVRSDFPLTKYLGNWSFAFIPWLAFEYFDLDTPRRRDFSVNADVEIRYKVNDHAWVSLLTTATRNFSNFTGNRYKRLDVGPVLGFTTTF